MTETENDETEEDQDPETEKDDEAGYYYIDCNHVLELIIETEKRKRKVPQEKIQSAGLKLQPNHDNRLIEKLLSEKS